MCICRAKRRPNAIGRILITALGVMQCFPAYHAGSGMGPSIVVHLRIQPAGTEEVQVDVSRV